MCSSDLGPIETQQAGREFGIAAGGGGGQEQRLQPLLRPLDLLPLQQLRIARIARHGDLEQRQHKHQGQGQQTEAADRHGGRGSDGEPSAVGSARSQGGAMGMKGNQALVAWACFEVLLV